MGRGNVCTHNECEGLYYLDRDLLDVYYKVRRCEHGHVIGWDSEFEVQTARELSDAGIQYDFDGSHTDWAYDRGESELNWDDMIEVVRDGITSRFSSFFAVDEWRGSDRRVVMESGLFQIAVVDNEWSAAWLLLEREDVDDTGGNRNLMRRHCGTYLEAIKRILIDEWGEAIGYGGAWTHGKKYTKEDVA